MWLVVGPPLVRRFSCPTVMLVRLSMVGLLIVRAVSGDGWAKAHIAKAMGVSRKCVHTWITRLRDRRCTAGLFDRSSRPRYDAHPHTAVLWRTRSWPGVARHRCRAR